MPKDRPRFGIPNPEEDTANWEDDYYTLTLLADQYLLEYGETADRPDEGDYHGEVYADIESGLIQYWDADDTDEWVTIAGQSVEAGFALTKSDNTFAVDASQLAGDLLTEDGGDGSLNVDEQVTESSADETISGEWTFEVDLFVDGILSEQENRVATRVWSAGGNIDLDELGVKPHSALDDSPADAHHTRPTVGNGIQENSGAFEVDTNDFESDGLEASSDGSSIKATERTLTYNPGHTEWEDGLDDEEINRFISNGDQFTIEHIAFPQKGGGSSSDASIEVYNLDTSTVLMSADLGELDSADTSAGAGDDLILRMTNNTGGPIVACPQIDGYQR